MPNRPRWAWSVITRSYGAASRYRASASSPFSKDSILMDGSRGGIARLTTRYCSFHNLATNGPRGTSPPKRFLACVPEARGFCGPEAHSVDSPIHTRVHSLWSGENPLRSSRHSLLRKCGSDEQSKLRGQRPFRGRRQSRRLRPHNLDSTRTHRIEELTAGPAQESSQSRHGS